MPEDHLMGLTPRHRRRGRGPNGPIQKIIARSISGFRWANSSSTAPVGLRVIGGFKLLGAVLLLGAGIGVFRLLGRDLGAALEHAAAVFHLDPHNYYIDRIISAASGIDAHRLKQIGVGTILYALLYGAEGTGLVLGKKWGGYLTVVVTALFIPLEIYEVWRKANAIRIGVLVVNLAILVYVVWKLVQEHRGERSPSAPAAARRPGLDAQQMPDEEVPPPALPVRPRARPVPAAGDDDQVEILVRLDERIHHLHRRRRVDVPVQLADRQQQFPLELVGIYRVRRRGVLGPDGPTHPRLVPPDLVHPIVMAAAIRRALRTL